MAFTIAAEAAKIAAVGVAQEDVGAEIGGVGAPLRRRDA
jgi:hypothetical protein